jgi:hypothetical protein
MAARVGNGSCVVTIEGSDPLIGGPGHESETVTMEGSRSTRVTVVRADGLKH